MNYIYKRKNITMECTVCGKKIKTSRSYQKYCGKECRNKMFREKYGRYNKGVTSGSTYHSGLLSEIGVSKILLENGFEIFRALGFGQFCDLIIFRNGKSYMADVKTSYERLDGTVKLSLSGAKKKSNQHKYTQIYLLYVQHNSELHVFENSGKEISIGSL